MAHLKNFGVGNFRAFKDLYNFDFAPITVLTGTNSSGKSSLIKAILTMKTTVKNKYLDPYNFEKISPPGYLNLGNFSTCVNKENPEKPITFQLPFEFTLFKIPLLLELEYIQSEALIKDFSLRSLTIYTNDEVLVREEFDSKKNAHSGKVSYSKLYKMLLGHSERVKENYQKSNIDIYNTNLWWLQGESNKLLKNKPLLNYLFLEDSKWINENINKLYGHLETNEMLDIVNQCRIAREETTKIAIEQNLSITELLLKWELEYLDGLVISENIDRVLRTNIFGLFVPFSFYGMEYFDEPSANRPTWVVDYCNSIKSKYPFLNLELIIKPETWQKLKGIKHKNEYHSDAFFFDLLTTEFKHSYERLKGTLNSIEYVSSVRTKVDRIYRVGSKDSSLDELLLEYLNTDFESGVIGWMSFLVKKLGIADKLEIVPTEDSAGAKIILTKDGKSAELADYGYGIAQLVPILLKIHIVINKAIPPPEFEHDPITETFIIILEEPETNLHPSLQSKLADVFVECNKRLGIEFIIETHSEYLIRRLQRRTAEFYNEKRKNDLSIPIDFTSIYYFYPPDNVPEGEKQVYKIEIEKDGALSKNFGTGFFDEAGNEDLLLYQIAKHNRN